MTAPITVPIATKPAMVANSCWRSAWSRVSSTARAWRGTLEMVTNRKLSTSAPTAQPARPASGSTSGGLSSKRNMTALPSTPIAIQGSRRPNRLRVRSEIQPITGSVMASKARPAAIATAMIPAGSATTST